MTTIFVISSLLFLVGALCLSLGISFWANTKIKMKELEMEAEERTIKKL